ncbi:serine/threonine-protein kinase TBK1 isoform X1 [Drosophila guanche]|uniref:Blast:Serine/threonine-protein kinase TBK1 n=2 Tax=Drosophila guanche TaxID=7266 RepID=A0A3B0K1Z4_DROGU|nr:serine/threonine-protein kinase TBK1 isoform X1 [Drosophila guanche]SPP79626.1 blast:Serine/threonine-protein kinase TBK1 [Drosophila guanche]
MSFLRGSVSYVWCTTSVLGKGATGSVFQGVNKITGESVAVKTFNPYSHMRPADVQMREFEALKKVNHENIVKLLAIEEDQEGRGKVIVMELCTGGSLFNILDDPENCYGLPEHEFLLVLEHLCAGMKHLRDNKLVHRDLKPGNIMKFISEDGQTIYKLTDFGAARELEDNQPFASLYGTEEYLHPDLYERAVLRKSIQRSFTANVDLWSIGVTLYHVATGNLPFRPFGGRKNRETMHQITTKKASGVISGTQLSENGPIEWSTTLPPHAHLSQGLKTLVTPLLAGLLEENREKTWSFDRFFHEVTLILRKRVIHVFYTNRTSSVEVFLEPEEQIDNFRERIFLQTEVPLEKQILLFNNEHLEKKVTPRTIAKAFPATTTEQPIFLYSNDDNNVQLPQQLDLPKFPVFPPNVSVENDASLAKAACSVGHECKRRVDIFTSMDILIKKGVEHFVEMLITTITLLRKKTESFDNLLSTVIDYADVVQSTAKSKSDQELKNLLKTLKNVKNDFDGAADVITQMHKHFVQDDELNDQWASSMHGKKCPCRTRASAQAKYLVERLRDSWQHLLRDRATRTLTYNDEQFHALEKIKVDHNGKRLKALLLDNVNPAVAQIAECLADWYKLAQTVYLKTQILEKDVRDCERKLNGIRDELYHIKTEQNLDGDTNTMHNNIQLLKLKERNTLREMQQQQQEVMAVMRKNSELITFLSKLGITNGSLEAS